MKTPGGAHITPAEIKAVAEEAFVYGLAMVMNHSVMCQYAVDQRSGRHKAPFRATRASSPRPMIVEAELTAARFSSVERRARVPRGKLPGSCARCSGVPQRFELTFATPRIQGREQCQGCANVCVQAFTTTARRARKPQPPMKPADRRTPWQGFVPAAARDAETALRSPNAWPGVNRASK